MPHAFDDVAGLTRINVMILERRTARRTRLYLPGPDVGAADLGRLYARLANIARGSFVVLAGSVPPGLEPTVYRDLVAWLKGRGVHTIVDASGSALEGALPAGPDLIKPNVEEAVAPGAMVRRRNRSLRMDASALSASKRDGHAA